MAVLMGKDFPESRTVFKTRLMGFLRLARFRTFLAKMLLLMRQRDV
jgi:hypothetical protein